MADSQYQSPQTYQNSEFTPFNANKIIQKRDTRAIKLHQAEHKLKSFNMMRIYLVIPLIFITARLIFDITQTDYAVPTLILVARAGQILGYLFGFQAHYAKKAVYVKVFFTFLAISFFIILLFCKWAYMDEDWVLLTEDIISFVVNCLLIWYCVKFYRVLKERDELKKALEETLIPPEIETL